MKCDVLSVCGPRMLRDNRFTLTINLFTTRLRLIFKVDYNKTKNPLNVNPSQHSIKRGRRITGAMVMFRDYQLPRYHLAYGRLRQIVTMASFVFDLGAKYGAHRSSHCRYFIEDYRCER